MNIGSKKKKILYTTNDVKISSSTYGKNNRPINLTTTKGLNYIFPPMINLTNHQIREIEILLSSKNKINIMFDNLNRIHKLNNIFFNWNENFEYKLIIISLDKGLIFEDYVIVCAIENIRNFYEDFNIFRLFHDKNEIVLIIYEDILINIPLEY